MRPRWSMLIPMLMGCGHYSTMELAGDRAAQAGNVEEAQKDYEEARNVRPILDADYNRLSDKYLAVAAPPASRDVREGIRTAPTDPVARVRTLLDVKATGRAAPAPYQELDKLDRVLEEASEPAHFDLGAGARYAVLRDLVSLRAQAIKTGVPVRVITNLDAAITTNADPAAIVARVPPTLAGARTLIVEELPRFQSLAAPQAALDAMVAAAVKVLAAAPHPHDPHTALDELEALLALRDAIRTAALPRSLDDGLVPHLDALGAITLPPIGPADGAALFTRVLAIRATALRLRVGTAALDFTARAVTAASAAIIVAADQAAAAHRYVAAIALLRPPAATPGFDTDARAKLAAIATAGAAYHAAQAAAQPAGFARLLDESLAAALGGPAGPRDAERTALAPQVDTHLALAFTTTGSCSLAMEQLSGSSTGRRTPTALGLSVCDFREEATTEWRKRPVTHMAQEQTGTHQEKSNCRTVADTEQVSREYCPGTLATDTCVAYTGNSHQECDYVDVPDYKDVETTEDVPYQVDVRTVHVRVQGVATFTTPDGAPLAVSFDIDESPRSESWSYQYPGYAIGAAPLTDAQAPNPSFTAASVARTQLAAVNAKIVDDARTQYRDHAAEAARAQGTADGYVRSVLIAGATTGTAATWFHDTYDLDADTATALLTSAAPLLQLTPYAWPATSPEFAGGTLVSTAEHPTHDASNHNDHENEIHGVTTESYHDDVIGAVDVGDWKAGIMPWRVDHATGHSFTQSVGFEMNWTVLGHVWPHYGPAIADALSFRFGFGARRGDHDYDNGESDGQISYNLDAGYRLMAGIRLPMVALYGGLGVGATRMKAGDSVAHGTHVEPTAELTFRVAELQNLHLQMSGFVYRFGSWSRRDRVSIEIPVSKKTRKLAVGITYESTDLDTDSVMQDGTTEIDLGKRPARLYYGHVGMVW